MSNRQPAAGAPKLDQLCRLCGWNRSVLLRSSTTSPTPDHWVVNSASHAAPSRPRAYSGLCTGGFCKPRRVADRGAVTCSLAGACRRGCRRFHPSSRLLGTWHGRCSSSSQRRCHSLCALRGLRRLPCCSRRRSGGPDLCLGPLRGWRPGAALRPLAWLGNHHAHRPGAGRLAVVVDVGQQQVQLVQQRRDGGACIPPADRLVLQGAGARCRQVGARWGAEG